MLRAEKVLSRRVTAGWESAATIDPMPEKFFISRRSYTVQRTAVENKCTYVHGFHELLELLTTLAEVLLREELASRPSSNNVLELKELLK